MLRGFSIFVFFGVMILLSSNSFAGFRVCNGTKNLIGVAIGYPSENGGWVTNGWWHIPGNACETIVKGVLDSRYYYLYAEGVAHGERWLGNVQMCVGQDEFNIVGIKDCYARGYLRVGFTEYDTGQHENWTVQLTDPSE
ncbi:DUF1036 domain-containing protein [Candidatus Liberibacter africanus]|uniref:Uncharacterized protein n=1 Tax=Candidatus Liberibacter africanus PTSAPSY TaxID=1277257 RepID=A0A0G3I8X2_LIBAF|nr:DUF1036 domain-containing protein [Candidatus Liberibacter africanus]AKK20212.1 hypothetical protein G293_02920 [Candidatus Liberibacter africanus PTSAPSY]QTP63991.1 DUF1036 domain-containing protein [Candidatus Liberibacter africanus]